jgi:hypothetical protein
MNATHYTVLEEYETNVRELSWIDLTDGAMHEYQTDISNVSGWTSGTRLSSRVTHKERTSWKRRHVAVLRPPA